MGSRVTTPCCDRRARLLFDEVVDRAVAEPARASAGSSMAGNHVAGEDHRADRRPTEHARGPGPGRRRQVERLRLLGLRPDALDLALTVPAFIPAAWIASVTPKLTSRLFRRLGRASRRYRTPGPRHEAVLFERAERLAQRGRTLRARPRAGARGEAAAAGMAPVAMREANSSRTEKDNRRFTSGRIVCLTKCVKPRSTRSGRVARTLARMKPCQTSSNTGRWWR